MGLSEKKQHQVMDVGLDSDTANKKWVIAGIPSRTPLKPIYTTNNPRPPAPESIRGSDQGQVNHDIEDDEYCISTTPTGEESKIPRILTCPPAPKKKKRYSSKCKIYGSSVIREFFTTPPDFETVFTRHHHVERAN
ncbi:hypothetical protein CsatB_022267 [Cannabis sativa]|uniref:Cyclin-dependent protein kinase inhibitor SMR6 n=2 Tax=Cannabis sativa TaxID=3483 RepID=A0A7J6F6G0_CANSA|nr:cyclin-dependent protein kinase inhibitor SMR6 [Cannabis sativa]KAF4366178.1 hypothetical protein F8388_014896 [Cannabis sativa]KAF4395559.1 hypothetical protein G4B88_011023 [Cannabis sativa]